MAYQGEGTYAGLKAGAVLASLFSVALAVALFVGADDPRVELDPQGGPFISTDPDPVVIVAAVLVLGEGILLAFVLWAIGTIGNHVIALRKQVAPMSGVATTPMGERGTTAPPGTLAPAAGSTPQHAEPPESGSTSTYGIFLFTRGTASANQLRKIVRRYSEQDPEWQIMEEKDVAIASRLAYVNADAMREDMEEAGAVVELREEPVAE